MSPSLWLRSALIGRIRTINDIVEPPDQINMRGGGGSLNSSFEDPSNTLIALLYIHGIVKSWSQENWLVSIKQSFPKFYSSIKFWFKCVSSKEPSTLIGHISKCNFFELFHLKRRIGLMSNNCCFLLVNDFSKFHFLLVAPLRFRLFWRGIMVTPTCK